jgi:hypothetical protein
MAIAPPRKRRGTELGLQAALADNFPAPSAIRACHVRDTTVELSCLWQGSIVAAGLMIVA